MSMLDSIFNKGVGGGAFRAAKCKTLLKLTIPRIKLLRNRREIQLKQMRRDIAKLLENGQEATARIRVEHIIREENMMAAQEIVELFCELITVRLPIIEAQRECPLDLKEAISSICFAAPRCADLPELQQVQMLFAGKYGKEFVAAATELMPGCGVNRQIIELLSVRAPPVEVKLKLLKEIAEEHELDWDPSATEAEFFKPHEDLLNGPNQHFITMQPMPEKNLDDTNSSAHVDECHYESDSDAGLDSLDLPEVPKDTVRPATGVPSAPNLGSHLGPSTDVRGPEHELKRSTSDEDIPHIPMKSDIAGHDPNVPSAFSASGSRQFVPFVNPPPSFTEFEGQTKFTPPLFSNVSDVSETRLSSDDKVPPSLPSEVVPSPLSHPTSPPSVIQNEPTSVSHYTMSSRQEDASPYSHKIETITSSPTAKSEIEVDLQDVLAAAHTAAETAERAAAAARAAASLAQVRITDLVSRRNKQVPDRSSTEIHEVAYQQNISGEQKFDRLNSFGNNFENSFASEAKPNFNSPTLSSPEVERSSNQAAHVPQRLPSLEDDPYDSYPNLFSSRDPAFKPGGDSEN